jgi:hypothetical protein
MCSGKGECQPSGTCKCAPGYGKADCSFKKCPNDCSGRGNCVKGACLCQQGWAKADCSYKLCDRDCMAQDGHGECKNGTCMCLPGWTGSGCHIPACPNQCSGRGQCDLSSGNCSCTKGWKGDACQTRHVVQVDGPACCVLFSVCCFRCVRWLCRWVFIPLPPPPSSVVMCAGSGEGGRHRGVLQGLDGSRVR